MTELPLRTVTPDEIATYRRDGVVVLKGIVAAEYVLAMADPVEAALTSPETADVGAFAGLGDQPAFRAGVDHWRVDPRFEAFSCGPTMAGIAAALLDSTAVWLYEDSILVKEAGAPYRTEFHTDAAYFHVTGEQVCTFWIPLDPVDATSGAVQYLVGSHTWDRDFKPNLFTIPDPVPGTEGERVPDILADPELRDRLVDFVLEPGDVVVHHYRTVHGAPANSHATRRRRAISLRYCGDDVRYRIRPGMPVRATQRDLAEGDALGLPDTPQVWPAS